MREYKGIMLAIVIGFVAYYISGFYVTEVQARLVGVIALLVTLWTNEALAVGIVSILPIIIFPSLDIIDTNATTSNYANSIIFLFLGGFLIAIATEKIGLHKVLADKLLVIFPSTPRGVILSLSISAATLSSVLSNTTTALLLMPLATFITTNATLRVRFLLAIAYGASIGGIITPIGTPPNLILLGFMQSHSLPMIGFAKWIFLALPLATIMLVVLGFILSTGTKGIKLENVFEVHPVVTSEQKRLFRIIIGLIVLLILNSPIKPYYDGLGLNENGILLGFGLLMFLPKIGFLEWEDTKHIPFDVIFLFGAGFSIAMAFSKTGLASSVASSLLSVSMLPMIVLVLIIATLLTFTTEITSNTALTSIALPIVYSLSANFNVVDGTLLLMITAICASYAFMLPIATPPNAIAMSTGAIRVKDMAKFGFVLNIVGILLTTLIAMFYWRYFL